MSLKQAMQTLCEALIEDKEYRLSWIANIAMAYMDCETKYIQETGKKYLNEHDRLIIANKAAEHFLHLLCDFPKKRQVIKVEE